MSQVTNKTAPTIKTYGGSYLNAETREKIAIDYNDRAIILAAGPIGTDYKVIKNQEVQIQFMATTASLLLDELEDAAASYKAGEPFNSMIECGVKTNNGVQICDGKVLGRPYGIYLVIYKDFGNDRKPANFAVYTMRNGEAIKDYNPMTGEGSKKIKSFREIKDIINNLSEFVKSSNRAAAHAFKDADKYRTSSLMQAAAVSKATGTSLGDNNRGGVSNNYTPNNNNNVFFNDDDADLSSALTLMYN